MCILNSMHVVQVMINAKVKAIKSAHNCCNNNMDNICKMKKRCLGLWEQHKQNKGWAKMLRLSRGTIYLFLKLKVT